MLRVQSVEGSQDPLQRSFSVQFLPNTGDREPVADWVIDAQIMPSRVRRRPLLVQTEALPQVVD